MAKQKVSVKNSNVKLIFEKMEYGEVYENIDLAKAWLQEHKEVFAYIDKKDKGSKGPHVAIKDANTGIHMCKVFSTIESDIDQIFFNAKQMKRWFSKEPEEKAVLINRLAEEIHKNSTLFLQLEVCLRGILSIDTKTKALPLLIDYLQYYSSWAANTDFTCDAGVAVNFIADNSFLGFLGCIIGPALAAGYNLILQTEPRLSPLVLLIIELAERVGIPEGTLRLVPGKVNVDAIFQNENASVITSLGSFNQDINIPIGKVFLAITYSKSPMIIFNNADIDSACDSVVDAAWGYQGLLPWSVNTLLVQEDIFQMVVEKLKYKLGNVKMGLATDKTADLSYPNDLNAYKELRIVINEAKLQGIEVFQSCEKTDKFQPTLLIGGKVFGNSVIKEDDNTDIVTMVAFRTVSEAINLANNTRYGFGASIWTENISLANEVAKGVNFSNVWINSYGSFTAAASFSPYKKSGYGIFGGYKGFYEFISANTGNTPVDYTYEMKPSKKSEGGVNNNIYKCPVGNDFHNIVILAKRGYQSWSNMMIASRGHFLRTVANEIGNYILQPSQAWNLSQGDTKYLMQLLYSVPTHLKAEDSTSTHLSFNVYIHYNPVGVVVIEAPDYVEHNFVCTILGSILLGNAVIVLCHSGTVAEQFCQELSKCMYQCKLTAGVFSVALNCNDNVIKAVLSEKEVDLYIQHNKSSIKPKIEHMKRYYNQMTNWKQIFTRVTLIKNVWFNIGESIL